MLNNEKMGLLTNDELSNIDSFDISEEEDIDTPSTGDKIIVGGATAVFVGMAAAGCL